MNKEKAPIQPLYRSLFCKRRKENGKRQPVYRAEAAHSLDGGGPAMELKHTNPQYETPAQRTERLRAVGAACLAAVRKVRSKEKKTGKGTA